jgi:hypothetical protein
MTRPAYLYPHEVLLVPDVDDELERLARVDSVPRVGRCPRLAPLPAWRWKVDPEPAPLTWSVRHRIEPVERHAVPPHPGGCWVSALNRASAGRLHVGIPPCVILSSHPLCPRCAAHLAAQEAESDAVRARRTA